MDKEPELTLLDRRVELPDDLLGLSAHLDEEREVGVSSEGSEREDGRVVGNDGEVERRERRLVPPSRDEDEDRVRCGHQTRSKGTEDALEVRDDGEAQRGGRGVDDRVRFRNAREDVSNPVYPEEDESVSLLPLSLGVEEGQTHHCVLEAGMLLMYGKTTLAYISGVSLTR